MTTASSYSDEALGEAVTGDDARIKASSAHADINRLPERDTALRGRPFQFRGGQLGPDQPRIVLFPQAVDKMAAHALGDVRSEVGGVLLGSAFRNASELYVEVQAALPAQTDDHGPIHFTFNADAWAQIHRDRAEKYPELDIVGWFHTHPGLGIFFSGDDVVVHSAAFVLPWHVAMVVDPLSKRMGCFAWDEGELRALPGFYEILDSDDAPTCLPWTLQRGEVWTESYVERMVAQRAEHSRDTERGFQVTPMHGIIAATFAILLSLGLLFGGILPMSSENETLRTMVAGLAEQNIEQANRDGTASCPDSGLRIYSPLPGEQVTYGQEITLVGTAAATGAGSYNLEIRPNGEQIWWPLGEFRRAVQTGPFLSWDTTSFAPGAYELRLSAVSQSGEVLESPLPCTVRFELSATALAP